jgi:hypothetical protein
MVLHAGTCPHLRANNANRKTLPIFSAKKMTDEKKGHEKEVTIVSAFIFLLLSKFALS